MGGYGSGRYGGRPTADASLRIDLAWMVRTSRAKEGAVVWGSLSWSLGDQPSGSISYRAIMDEPGVERLELSYTRGSGEDAEQVRQTVRLCSTRPHYGGKRWWMICPYRGIRVAKTGVPGYWLEQYVDRSDDAVAELVKQYVDLKHDARGNWRPTIE